MPRTRNTTATAVEEVSDEDVATADAVAASNADTSTKVEHEYDVDSSVLSRLTKLIETDIGPNVFANMARWVDAQVEARAAIKRHATGISDWAGRSEEFKAWNAKRFEAVFPPLSDDEAMETLSERRFAYSAFHAKSVEVSSPDAITLPPHAYVPEKLGDLTQEDLKQILTEGSKSVYYVFPDAVKPEFLTGLMHEKSVATDAQIDKWNASQEKLRPRYEAAVSILSAIGGVETKSVSGKPTKVPVLAEDAVILSFEKLPDNVRDLHAARVKNEREKERDRLMRSINERALRKIRSTVKVDELRASGLKVEEDVLGGTRGGGGGNGSAEQAAIDSTHEAIVTSLMADELPLHEKVATLADAVKQILAAATAETVAKMAGGDRDNVVSLARTMTADLDRLIRQFS